MARDDADLPSERRLRARRPSTIFGVHDELREWSSHGVRLSLGDREWVQVDQTVHGCDDVEGFRASILLLRVCVSAVLDLASGRFARPGRVDG